MDWAAFSLNCLNSSRWRKLGGCNGWNFFFYLLLWVTYLLVPDIINRTLCRWSNLRTALPSGASLSRRLCGFVAVRPVLEINGRMRKKLQTCRKQCPSRQIIYLPVSPCWIRLLGVCVTPAADLLVETYIWIIWTIRWNIWLIIVGKYTLNVINIGHCNVSIFLGN